MRSNCCNADIKTNYGDEGTNYYTCSSCQKPCDISSTKVELPEDVEKRFEDNFTSWLPFDGIWNRKEERSVDVDLIDIKQFIAQELEKCRQQTTREVVEKLKKSSELWFDTYDKNNKNFMSEDFIKFITEGL